VVLFFPDYISNLNIGWILSMNIGMLIGVLMPWHAGAMFDSDFNNPQPTNHDPLPSHSSL
jgi:hypothetical protein